MPAFSPMYRRPQARRPAPGGRVPGAGFGDRVWRRLRRDSRALVGLWAVAVLGLAAVLAPWLAPHARDRVNVGALLSPPSARHWLGTDELGRDVLSRLLWGGRVSLTVGLVAVGISVTVGTLAGAVSGYYGGKVDRCIMGLCDLFLSIPFLPLALTLAALVKPSIYHTMAIIGVLGWTGTARLVRGELLTLKEREFVAAARAGGVPDSRILWRHLVPNALAPVLVAATLGVAGAILSEAALSFLGLGVPQPVPSWGNMLSGALSIKVLLRAPWVWLPPGVCIFVAVLGINLLGDGLRDALDPRSKD